MCQAALADLKMAIRAAGEHKQRIAVQVSIDGLRLRDEKSGVMTWENITIETNIQFLKNSFNVHNVYNYLENNFCKVTWIKKVFYYSYILCNWYLFVPGLFVSPSCT